MKTIYVQLATIFLTQEYHELNQSIDFQWIPTPECQRNMTALGWIMKPIPKGYGIFARTATAKPSALQYADAANIVLRFVIRVLNPFFYHVADLGQALRVGKNMLYFNNIKTEGRGLLADNPLWENPAYKQVPIRWMATPIYRDTLVVPAHVTQVSLTIEAQKNDETVSRFLKTLHWEMPDTDLETKIDYAVDLSTLEPFTEGRYELFKTLKSGDSIVKSSESIFYAPDWNEIVPMCAIEIWASSGSQPFLGEGIILPVRYHLHFASKSILLQYVVENHLTKKAVASDALEIRHRIDHFDIEDYAIDVEQPDTQKQAGKVLFTAQDTIKWQATMKTPILTYQNGSEENHLLPMPEPSVAPIWDEDKGQYIVKVFVTF